ncbi:hypothetical protein KC318_g12682 [Hortaea werneckii]|uniref:Uncharacterized protein n=1 Tax=Hortaea werneckii TaxID=91943 RepID=A0A3M7AE92_HORWE|nr:hypothetical protein KC334_g14445 [Hortaea werneckii]KAI6949490.1 hypothetical protein KC355_g14515 [Hortaea werneckii]KAI7656032.1 hypothetical protein KC318_g12682 [Hortaea werneckii]RMY25762.1 hypothetical protein D0867_00500 [Hortaea werneckii]RMY36762.1 hypothetical protein D0866_03719 [Hortaea werneckii]
MNILLLLSVLLGIFLTLLLAFFALSSCLGDEIRAVWFQQGRHSGRNSRSAAPPTTYGLQYARFMGGATGGDVQASSGWEGIEMEDLLDKRLGGGRAEEEEEEEEED